jgi:hypothetical protein
MIYLAIQRLNIWLCILYKATCGCIKNLKHRWVVIIERDTGKMISCHSKMMEHHSLHQNQA